MSTSEAKTPISNTSGNNKRKTVIKDNSSDVEMKNNDNNSSDAITSKEFNSIKITKSKIFNDQRTKLENWLFQLKLYFVFNAIKNDRKTLFAVNRMNEKVFNWIKSNIKQFLHDDKDIDEIFNVFDRFKIIIRRVFNVTNEIIIFIKMIQHLLQKTSTVDYAQQFKKHVNNISWNDKILIIMFYRDLKSNIKDKIIKKKCNMWISMLSYSQ